MAIKSSITIRDNKGYTITFEEVASVVVVSQKAWTEALSPKHAAEIFANAVNNFGYTVQS